MASKNWTAKESIAMREDFEKRFPDAANGFKALVEQDSKRNKELESVCRQAKNYNVPFDKLADVIYKAVERQEKDGDVGNIAAYVNNGVKRISANTSDKSLPISSSASSNDLALNLRIPVDIFVKLQSFADTHKMSREAYATRALTNYVTSSQASVDNDFEKK